MRLLRIFSILFLALYFSYGITVLWDRNPEPEVAGYRVYVGTNSRSYTLVIDAGNNIFCTFEPIPNAVNYIAVTAYDVEGLESVFSAEVTWTPAFITGPPVSIRPSPALGFIEVSFNADANKPYDVLWSTNLVDWSVFCSVIYSSNTVVTVPVMTYTGKMFFKTRTGF